MDAARLCLVISDCCPLPAGPPAAWKNKPTGKQWGKQWTKKKAMLRFISSIEISASLLTG
jgi:hypothetical protein